MTTVVSEFNKSHESAENHAIVKQSQTKHNKNMCIIYGILRAW